MICGLNNYQIDGSKATAPERRGIMSGSITANALNSARSQKWDILKFVMIFLVVLGHAADFYTGNSEQMRSLYFFIYIFHMPIFIFVSGLFAKRTVNEKRKDKIFGYLVIYIVLKVLFFAEKTLAGANPKVEIFSEGGIPWFMLALFAFMIITILIKDFSPKFILPFSILLACIAGYDNDIGDFLAISRIIVYYPFFYAGYCLDRKKVEAFCSGKAKKAFSLVLLAALAAFVLVSGDEIYWLRPLLTGRNPFSTLGEYAQYGFAIRLAYYFIVAVVCCAIITVMPDKTPFGIAAKLGQRTLAVYTFHYVALFILYNVFNCKEIFDELFPGFAGWVIIPISVVITLLFSLKPFNDIVSSFLSVPMIKKTEKE